MKYANNVSCSPGAEDCTADSAYFDEDAVSAVQKNWSAVFEANPHLVHVLLDVPIPFELYAGYRGESDPEDHYAMDWEAAGWRYRGVHLNRFAHAWLMFSNKHRDLTMEVKLW